MQQGPSTGHRPTQDVTKDQVCLGVGGGGHENCNLSWRSSLAAGNGLVTNGNWFSPSRI